jgi:bacterioferritin-associated ferredoxin
MPYGGHTVAAPAIDNQSQVHHLWQAILWFPWMIVCVCNRLTEAQIRTACEAGPKRAEDVYGLCGVKRNCGRCQETIAEILEETRAETSKRGRAA